MSGLLQEKLGHHAKRLGITISFSHEEVPMDTAGPLALGTDLILNVLSISHLLRHDLFIGSFHF